MQVMLQRAIVLALVAVIVLSPYALNGRASSTETPTPEPTKRGRGHQKATPRADELA